MDLSAAQLDGSIYAFGTSIEGDCAAERYDIAGDQWVPLPNMKHLRSLTTAAELDGHIYVLGGFSINPVSIVEEYNPGSRKWSKSPNMSEEKYDMKAAAWRGKVFVTGGVDEDTRDLKSCEAYDPTTMRWTKVGSMITARSGHGLATVGDMLVAIGGNAGLGGVTAEGESYDEESDEWRPLCPMPTPRTTFGCCAVPLAALEPLLAGAGEVRAARLLVKGHAAEVQQTAVRAQAVVQVQVLQASQLADGHAHLVCANLEENQLCVRQLRGEELSQGIQQQLENSIS